MSLISRREALAGAACGVCGLLVPSVAGATVLKGLSLEALAKSSQRILMGTALEAVAHWETVGGRRRIVTDTRVRVDDMIHEGSASDPELLVRTLGGTVGDIAALVHGEALLALNQPCVVFLETNSAKTLHRVVGMAQGHYPVRRDEARALRLQVSPQAPELVGKGEFAMMRLRGQEIGAAKQMILEALRQ